MLAACGAQPPQATQLPPQQVTVEVTAPPQQIEVTRVVEVEKPAAPAVPGNQVLRWALEGINEPSTLDPAKAGDAPVVFATGLIFRGLIQLDAQLHVVPDGAESWTVSSDTKVYTFKIRKDLKFSDGSPVTAEDAAFSITRSLDPKIGGGNGGYYLSNILGAEDFSAGKSDKLDGVKALDAQTLEITLKNPSAYFLYQLNFITGYILSKKNVTEGGEKWYEKPVGTGPFVLGEWQHNQKLVLTPNANYWAGAPNQLKQVDLIFYGGDQGSTTAFNDYQTGAVDVVGSFGQNPIPSQFVPQVKDLPDYHSAPQFVVRYLGFNNKIAPFNDVKVRQAFALAIDKSKLIKLLGESSVRAQDRILPGGIPASELKVDGLSFDAVKAKTLLAEAKFDPATKVTISYGTEGDNAKVLEFLQQEWKQNLGVEVTLEPLELQTFSQKLTDTYNKPEEGLQAYYSVWGADYPDPQNWISQQLRTDVGNNNGHYSNAEFDKLVDAADVEVKDPAARLKAYNQAEQIAVTEVGWLPLFSPNANALVKSYVTGLVFTGQGIIVPDWTAVRGVAQ
ncbi:MAG: peptide ABC transporter substrate-binding protein [Chloroflexi bacterium]|nr:peptide ABC transporter substrate-binding protein [Chloroflexota bacterium]